MNARKAHILIVDDEPAARYGMRRVLEGRSYTISEAADGREALALIASCPPDVVLCDIHMPEMDGLKILRRIQDLGEAPPPVIVITAYGSEKVAVEAMKAGAYDYLSKPYDIDELRLLVRKALDKVHLERENRLLRRQLAGLASSTTIIGESPAIRRVISLVQKVAATDVTVLLSGESGTGKELVARNIHVLSQRAEGPFITMNCAAIPRDLVESELFGHEKGAFTGASSRRLGKFELADGGTLFLDEIADMSLETQSKILRLLEEKSFIRLGGSEVIHSDVRLVSATNKNLEVEIHEGRFRSDLYFRLKVIEIPIPRLAERLEDIPILVGHFSKLFANKHDKSLLPVDSEAMRRLVEYRWPGNVRQLMHVIEQSVVLSEGDRLQINNLPDEISAAGEIPGLIEFEQGDVESSSFNQLKKRAVRHVERDIIEKMLQASRGNVSEAARRLKIKRQFLQHKIRVLGIETGMFRKRR